MHGHALLYENRDIRIDYNAVIERFSKLLNT